MLVAFALVLTPIELVLLAYAAPGTPSPRSTRQRQGVVCAPPVGNHHRAPLWPDQRPAAMTERPPIGLRSFPPAKPSFPLTITAWTKASLASLYDRSSPCRAAKSGRRLDAGRPHAGRDGVALGGVRGVLLGGRDPQVDQGSLGGDARGRCHGHAAHASPPASAQWYRRGAQRAVGPASPVCSSRVPMAALEAPKRSASAASLCTPAAGVAALAGQHLRTLRPGGGLAGRSMSEDRGRRSKRSAGDAQVWPTATM